MSGNLSIRAEGENYLQHAMRGQRDIRCNRELINRLAGNDRDEYERRDPSPRTINAINRFAGNKTNKRERRHPPPRRIEGDVALTPTQNTRAVTLPVQMPAFRMPPPQTPASQMPSPQTPVFRIKEPQSSASRLVRRTPSPAYILRSTGTYDDGVNARPRVVRPLFPTPGPIPNASEHQT